MRFPGPNHWPSPSDPSDKKARMVGDRAPGAALFVCFKADGSGTVGVENKTA